MTTEAAIVATASTNAVGVGAAAHTAADRKGGAMPAARRRGAVDVVQRKVLLHHRGIGLGAVDGVRALGALEVQLLAARVAVAAVRREIPA